MGKPSNSGQRFSPSSVEKYVEKFEFLFSCDRVFCIVDKVLKKVNDLVEQIEIQNSQYVADSNKNDCGENSRKFGLMLRFSFCFCC